MRTIKLVYSSGREETFSSEQLLMDFQLVDGFVVIQDLPKRSCVFVDVRIIDKIYDEVTD